MFFLAGLLNRSSLSFLFVTSVRLLSIVAILFTIAVEIYLIAFNIHKLHEGGHTPSGSDQAAKGSSLVEPALRNNTSDISSVCGYENGSNVPKTFGGILFFVLGQIFNMVVLILCLLSELSPPRIPEFFEHFFPPLGPSFGVGILGSLEVYVSCVLLSHHLSKIGLAAGWFLFIIGALNILLGLIYGPRIRAKRSLLDAGTAYAKKATHIDDIETGIHLAKKGTSISKKTFKNLRPSMISRPRAQSKPDNLMSDSSQPRKLEISRPIIDYMNTRFENDNRNLNDPKHVEIPASLSKPPPPIYDSFKSVRIGGSRHRPTPSA